MTATNEPVRVNLTVSDWQTVPTHNYTKTIEFDREEWDEMSPRSREQEIEEQLREFKNETFAADYDIENADLDDPTT